MIRIGRWRRIVRTTCVGRKSPRGAGARTEADYWDRVLDDFRPAPVVDPWRAYMRRVYGRLIADWLSPPAAGRALKTDLFEEAITPDHVLGELGPRSVGLDTSPAIAHAARARFGTAYHYVVADLRQLPFRHGCIPRILAGSSLDHFPESRDIDVCLAELARILTPGGVLVVTFDNPANPAVRLRNALPFEWLYRLGIVPYYVGATYGFADAARALAAVGLRVTAMRAVAHAPRAPAMWLSALTRRVPALLRLAARVESLIDRCESLERLPTRDRTAYYVALRAVKD